MSNTCCASRQVNHNEPPEAAPGGGTLAMYGLEVQFLSFQWA